jgi:hypothetical protein
LLLLQVRWPFGGNVLVTEAAEMFQNYLRDVRMMRRGPLEDEGITFQRRTAVSARSAA